MFMGDKPHFSMQHCSGALTRDEVYDLLISFVRGDVVIDAMTGRRDDIGLKGIDGGRECPDGVELSRTMTEGGDVAIRRAIWPVVLPGHYQDRLIEALPRFNKRVQLAERVL